MGVFSSVQIVIHCKFSHHYDGLAAESQRRRVFFWGIKKGVDLFKERPLSAVKHTKAVTVSSMVLGLLKHKNFLRFGRTWSCAR